MITSDLTLQPISMGLVPWKTNSTGPVDEDLYGNISGLPPATYYLYLAVAPAGSLNSFYLWTTSFTVTAAPPTCPYVGTCTGTFSGDDYGTWQTSIDNNCLLSGSGYSAEVGHFTVAGNVTSNGVFTMVGGSVNTGAVFSGQIDGSGNISGTWWDDYWQVGGTFEGHY